MDKLKAALVAPVAIGISAPVADAEAHGRHHRPRAHVGIWFGAPAPVFYPHYYPRYYPRYYYPPTVVVPAPAYPPPVYIEQPQTAAPAPTQGSAAYWYYCRDTQTYYPYVQQCASPWEQVVPNSAPPS